MLKRKKTVIPIMLQKPIIFVLIIVFTSTFGFANLEVLSTSEASFDCKPQVLEDKTFIARTSEIDIGLWCSDMANVLVYSCSDVHCSEKSYITYASKVRNILPTIIGFDVGTKYNYECLECPIYPTLSIEYESLVIKESERFELKATCVDSKGRIGSLQFVGWLSTSLKVTGFNDSGEYSARVICGDQNGLTVAEELIITVLDVNRPPTINAILKE